MNNMPVHDRVLTHITKGEIISIEDQAALLGIARSSVYYRPVAPNPEDFIIMNRIDEIYTEQPYYGIRPMTEQLKLDGFWVNHKRVGRLMKEMGIEAIYPKPNTSKKDPSHSNISVFTQTSDY
jgi:putative transposase